MERRAWYPESAEGCLALADVIVVVHFAIVLYVLLGQLAILLGGWRGWRWVRRPLFRLSHVGLIVFVAGEAVCGSACPLTVWENELRALGGAPIEQSSFVAYWAHELLFLDAAPEAFTVAYVLFAALVVGSFWLVPLRRRVAREGA
ncbi:MAG: DUF2784 domain-containing protein [Planctomycetes bacterium]|nr:DUF2784 domain-containing protein [Planctomycetota bacterium]